VIDLLVSERSISIESFCSMLLYINAGFNLLNFICKTFNVV